jgi:ElaB/YqjD/DUF883 family membrane-anchored ribosome-binding protein
VKDLVDRRIVAAKAEAKAARAKLMATLGEVRHRLDPRVVASETVDSAVSSAANMLDNATTAVRSRPWMLGLGATAAGLMIAARSRRKDDETEATNPDAES